MIKGVCPRCGQIVFGYALLQPNHRICKWCGTTLKLFENNQLLNNVLGDNSSQED